MFRTKTYFIIPSLPRDLYQYKILVQDWIDGGELRHA